MFELRRQSRPRFQTQPVPDVKASSSLPICIKLTPAVLLAAGALILVVWWPTDTDSAPMDDSLLSLHDTTRVSETSNRSYPNTVQTAASTTTVRMSETTNRSYPNAVQTTAPTTTVPTGSPATAALTGSAGYCSDTDIDMSPGACDLDPAGSWNATALGIDSLAACVAACEKCSQCRYVSYNPIHRDPLDPADCSWYLSCDMSELLNVEGYRSIRVQAMPTPPPSNTSATLAATADISGNSTGRPPLASSSSGSQSSQVMSSEQEQFLTESPVPQIERLSGPTAVKLSGPTAVNLGLPRTGTTSLHVAVQQLGLKGTHIAGSLQDESLGSQSLLNEFLSGRADSPDVAALMRQDLLSDSPFYLQATKQAMQLFYPNSTLFCTKSPKARWINSVISHGNAGGRMMTNANASSVLGLWRNVNRTVCCPYRDTESTRRVLADIWDTHYERPGGVCTGGLPEINVGDPDNLKWRSLCTILENKLPACSMLTKLKEWPREHMTDGLHRG